MSLPQKELSIRALAIAFYAAEQVKDASEAETAQIMGMAEKELNQMKIEALQKIRERN